MAADRGPFAPAALAGAILFVSTSLPEARAGDLDAPMQPLARDAVPIPLKRNAPPPADASAEPIMLRSADRLAPEFQGDRSAEMPAPDPFDPMDVFVDRTVDAMGSLNSTTNSILRPERP